jgi:hypothetical protein
MPLPQGFPEVWRIPYIPHGAPGGRGYRRAYGWGYLSWPGIAMVIGGAAALAVGRDASWKFFLIGGGFVLTWIGIVLNGLSERRGMRRVMARCVDVELQHLPGIHRQRSAGWAVRARMAYQHEGVAYESTPGDLGYALLGSRKTAAAFAEYLKTAPGVPLYVDPKCPRRSLFTRLSPPSGVIR